MTTILFLDCEFTGLTKKAELISLCLYQSDSTYFYAEFNDYDKNKLSNWHIDNVISKLFFQVVDEAKEEKENSVRIKGNKQQVVILLKNWLAQFESIEIWGDVPAYDWVLFCDLFGGALQLPANIFYMQFDLATVAKISGVKPDFSRFEFAGIDHDKQHNALEDARVEKLCYNRLVQQHG